MSNSQSAITPRRSENYPEWYQQVVKASDLAEVSAVRGCMVIKPWGYGIWENVQKHLDKKIKDTGHENAYFPLLIPLSFLEKEATHVEGFAKECAVVTHHRLEARDGKLVPAGPLEEPLVIRPTSETIIGDSFAKWVQSYRDLPLLINQWANVFRWEMRTRVFLRTAEFLWQEGHTVHASEAEAIEETKKMLEVYRSFAEDFMAMPVVTGEKIPQERFPGAEITLAIEAMMQDRKALQAGTSHYLGQNFAKASGIKFLNKDGALEFGYTTSWGASTRLIGGLIMTHSDDDGLRVPPRIAPKQIVILPVIPDASKADAVLQYAKELATALRAVRYEGEEVTVHVDTRDMRGGDKNWQWVKKGIPLRVEVGPRDIEKNQVVLYRRDQTPKDKIFIGREDLINKGPSILTEIQKNYFSQALAFQRENTTCDVKNPEDFKRYFTPKNIEEPEIHGGWVRAPFSGNPEAFQILDELKVTVRCMPFDQSGAEGKCVVTGVPAKNEVIFAKAY